jgi:hypothetical protein
MIIKSEIGGLFGAASVAHFKVRRIIRQKVSLALIYSHCINCSVYISRVERINLKCKSVSKE